MEVILLDKLNVNSVSVLYDKNGERGRVSYRNSPEQRQKMEEEVPQPYKSVILLMFGETTTMED